MPEDADIDALLHVYDEARHELRIFMQGIVQYIGEHPDLNRAANPVVHSFKSRLKDRDHLREKLTRKRVEGRDINENNLFHEITDLAGVRILHLFQESFGDIDAIIRRKIAGGDWFLGERPRAYTWDPEAVQFFSNFDLNVPKNQHPIRVCII